MSICQGESAKSTTLINSKKIYYASHNNKSCTDDYHSLLDTFKGV